MGYTWNILRLMLILINVIIQISIIIVKAMMRLNNFSKILQYNYGLIMSLWISKSTIKDQLKKPSI